MLITSQMKFMDSLTSHDWWLNFCRTNSRAMIGCVSLLLLFVGLAASKDCGRQYLIENGLSVNYNETIAHAIHSMTVEGLQMFNPRASADNHVPTVNMDRRSPIKVVPFAPDDPLSSDFSTHTMNVIDKILSNVGKENDGLGPYWSPLERVVHKFHMLDVWERVRDVFESEVAEHPPSNEVCRCLVNTKVNGIYNAVKWVSDHYDSGTPITLLNRPIPKLTDANSWSIWKRRLLYYYQPQTLRDAARYLYCATKDF